MIVAAIGGGPLEQAGVTPPLRIRAIAPRGDGRFVATDGVSNDDVMLLLQGRAGTPVQIRVGGGLFAEAKEISIVRALHPEYGKNPHRLQVVLEAHERLLATVTADVDETAADGFGAVVILVTGESINGRIDFVSEDGVRVEREGAEPVTIPTAMVKALELVPTMGVTISPEKFRSLTTLPRSQRHAPPTHLIRSVRGDYLRGRLAGMDGENLRIVLEADPRGKPMAIPRAEVSRVIWLHPEMLAPGWQPPPTDTPTGLPVEMCVGRTKRLRMAAVGIEGNVLVGRHAILGDERIDVDAIDRLLIGGALVDTPNLPPFAKWELRPASEPRNLPPKKPAKP